jgi:hypothetical protein
VKGTFFVSLAIVACAAPTSAQRGAVLTPPTDLVTSAIPGAVVAGTTIELVKGDFPRTEDKDGEYLLAFDVKADGTLTNRRNFAKYKSVKQSGSKDPLLAEDNGADGLAIDAGGRVYVATNVGIEVFSPKGQYLGAIPAIWGGETFNLKKPQNIAFAGPDKKTLYMVGAGAVFKVQTLAQGVKGRAK